MYFETSWTVDLLGALGGPRITLPFKAKTER